MSRGVLQAMKTCHECRYYLKDTPNPYGRCLVFYHQAMAIEQLKKGLVGGCDRYMPEIDKTITCEGCK